MEEMEEMEEIEEVSKLKFFAVAKSQVPATSALSARTQGRSELCDMRLTGSHGNPGESTRHI